MLLTHFIHAHLRCGTIAYRPSRRSSFCVAFRARSANISLHALEAIAVANIAEDAWFSKPMDNVCFTTTRLWGLTPRLSGKHKRSEAQLMFVRLETNVRHSVHCGYLPRYWFLLAISEVVPGPKLARTGVVLASTKKTASKGFSRD